MFDESFMYKMISFFNIVQRPSNDWGKSPESRHQTTLGDDIERLQKRRNALVHSPSAQLSESTFEEYFDELSEIAQRFDTHLHQSYYRNRFQDEVIGMKRKSPDLETQAKYIALLEEKIEMKKVTDCHIDHHLLEMFLGRNINDLIEKVRRVTGDELNDNVWVNMYLFRVTDRDRALSRLRMAVSALEQSSGQQLVVTHVEESSILFHLRVKKGCFKDSNNFIQEVLRILKLLLPYAKDYLEYNLQVVLSINTVKGKLKLISVALRKK
ncbi:unnamed protein product [Mytilus edulis]|uniref:DZIP3-like HEPN domain-containing protein n=1 Tax=Mytilus edulis TaxID=6550 RepID=A0A8S3Q5N4_MYTED|nr:unnamed protein product [Mytilus edulis]